MPSTGTVVPESAKNPPRKVKIRERNRQFCLTLYLTMLTMPNSKGPKPPALEMARVLLVDDNPAARLTLQTVLTASGYRVDSAASAAEAYFPHLSCTSAKEHGFSHALSAAQEGA